MTSLPGEIVDFLPPDVEGGEVVAHALLGRSFDRANGEALVVRTRAGSRHILTRPDRFELFRELPRDESQAMQIHADGPEPRLVVRAIDGRELAMSLLDAELPTLRAVLETDAPMPPVSSGRRARSPTPAPRPRKKSSSRGMRAQPAAAPAETSGEGSKPGQKKSAHDSDRRARSATLRPPESAEMEVVKLPRSMRAGGTGPREPVSSRGHAPPAPRSASQLPPPREGESQRVPQAARAAARATPIVNVTTPPDETSDHESVRPPALALEPVPVVKSARDLDALRASLRWHWERGQLDEASCVARVLVHLGVGDALDRRLANLSPEAPPSFARPLSPYLVRAYLAHEDEDPDFGRLLTAIWPAVLSMRSRPERDLGLRPRDEVDAQRSDAPFARLFAHAARAFGLPTPRLFLRTDVPGGMAHLVVQPLASLCGGTLATGFAPPAVLHVLGSHVSMYRPEAYLMALVPAPADLMALVLAGLAIERRIPNDPRLVNIAEQLERHMIPMVRESLRAACDALSLGGEPRARAAELLTRFRRAVYLTGARAGFALSGSLSVSDKMQRMMPAVPGVPADEIVDDLITYSISPAWLTLRKELGLALEPSSNGTPLPPED